MRTGRGIHGLFRPGLLTAVFLPERRRKRTPGREFYIAHLPGEGAAGPRLGTARVPGVNIAAIIPAYNEEHTIGRVIEAVHESGLVDSVVVVSDGSTDRTAEAARRQGAQVIELGANAGKGAALKAGTDSVRADVYLFLDADLIGLRGLHVRQLLTPVLTGEAEMTVGVFGGGRLATDLAQRIAPFLSGQRAVTRQLLERIPELGQVRYGVEVALTRHSISNNITVREVVLKDLTHRMKEEKLGFWRGFHARLRMYWEIARYLRWVLLRKG